MISCSSECSFKNVGFISTRIAGTDGVSLETAKWADVLTKEGFSCFYFAGKLINNHLCGLASSHETSAVNTDFNV